MVPAFLTYPSYDFDKRKDTLLIMFENIAFVVMAVIAVGAGIWVWWLENHGQESDTKNNEGDKVK